MQSFICSSCGKQNESGAKFCNNCARPMFYSADESPVDHQQAPQPVKPNSSPISFSKIVVLVVCGLLLLWFISWSYQNNFGSMRGAINSFMGWKDAPQKPLQSLPPKSNSSIAEKPPRNLNLWKYNGITTGMKQEEVEKILGSKGKQTYDATDRTGSMSMYTWEEGEAATKCMIQITFINRKVHDKTQFGLE